MPQAQTGQQPITQITVVEPEPGKQNEALSLMQEPVRLMAQSRARRNTPVLFEFRRKI